MIIDISSLIPAISFLFYIIFTVFGLYQAREEKIRWSFIIYMFTMSIWSFGSFMMHANTQVLTPLFWNRFMVVGMFGAPITIYSAMLAFSQIRSRRYNVVKFVGYAIFVFLVYLNFSGNVVTEAGFENGLFYYTLADGAVLAYSLSYSYLILCVVLLARVIRKAENSTTRKMLLLPLYGFIIMIGGVLANLYEPLGRYPIDLFATTLNAFFIFYSIYKYRLVHYSAVVLRIILYFILLLMSAFIFYAILWLVSKNVREIPFIYLFFISLLLGGVAAFIFEPLKQGMFNVIERLYFGNRIEYYRSLMNFSQSLTSIVDLYTLGDLTIKKIVDTFNLNWAFMTVLDYSTRNYRLLAFEGFDIPKDEIDQVVFSKDSPLVTSFLEQSDTPVAGRDIGSLPISLSSQNGDMTASLILPLKFKERVNGCIVLGEQRDTDYYNQFELETLQILAGQCSISLENAISFERLKAQQKRLQSLNTELSLSRNKLEAFFDGITSPISIQDINYNIIMVNLAATRYFRKSFDELVQQKCYSVYFNRDKPCDNCMAQDCLHTQLPFGIELKDDSADFTFAVSFYPITVPEDSDTMFLELFQDITEQKRLQRELVQSEKLAGIGTLASGIAHEINNPLGGIIGTAEILLEELEKEPELHGYAQDIIKYSQTAAEVIKDLTNYSRHEEKLVDRVNINEILKTSLKLAQRGMDFQHIELLEYYEELPHIEANTNEVQQVFINLIINAVQSMLGKGILTIESRQQDNNAVISIKDTGHGIEEENLEKIFTPFFTTKEPGKGTGLGLSITHQIIQGMGGRINTESKVGRGTRFTVTLPLTEEKKWRIRFVHANDRKTLDDVFFLQRKILVGEKGYREESIQRDADEMAFHILAYKGLQPVGTVSCLTPETVDTFPIERNFGLNNLRSGMRCSEIDRLAVLKEQRGSIIPLGLMTLAYLHAKFYDAERVFLDVFADEKKHITMYNKLGFQVIGEYYDPLPVTVMMLDHKTDYEMKGQQLERFVKPFLTRLVKRVDFDEPEREKILTAVEQIMTSRVAS